MQYRPLQFSYTSQCSIVRRDKRREQQREAQLLLAQSAAQQSRTGAGAAAATPPALAQHGAQLPGQREGGQGVLVSPAKRAVIDNEGEEEEAINRADFRWKG